MSQTQGLFRLAHPFGFAQGRPLSLALAGGRAPVCWQRELARAAARLDALRRAGAWVDEVITVYPKLWDEPLLGNCLAVLAAEVARPAGIESEVARRVREGPTGSAASAAREQRSASDRGRLTRRSAFGPSADLLTVHPQTPYRPGESRPHNVGPDLTGVPRQAGLALLRRLVGERAQSHQVELPCGSLIMSPGVGRAHRRSDRPQAKARRDAPLLEPMNFREQSSEPLTETRRRPRAQPRSGAHEPTASRAWQIDLARRAVNALHGTNLSPLAPTEQGKAFLARNWSVPIAGPLAPLELLTRSVRLSQPNGGASHSDGHNITSQPSPDSQRSNPPSPANDAGARTRRAIMPVPLRGEDKESLPPLGEDSHHCAPEDVPRTNRWIERIAPPVVIPSLPPLIRPEVVGMPVPPVATATARQGAWAEATAADDNLDVLAAKIKRILDEEARRHGIDV